MYVMYFCNVYNHVIISTRNDMTFRFLGCFVSTVSQWSGLSLLACNLHWNLFAAVPCSIDFVGLMGSGFNRTATSEIILA